MSVVEFKTIDAKSSIIKFLNGSLTVTIKQGDLALEVCDAIVNPTNNSMKHTGGLDTKLHQTLGDFFANQVKAITNELQDNSCPIGDSRIFIAKPARDEKCARFVINTVGPNYAQEDNDLAAFHLRECYRTSLLLANTYKLSSIAYPAISCGAYKYPLKKAAQVGIEAVRQNSHEVKDVRYVLFEKHIYDAFVEEWREYSDKINKEANVIDDPGRDRDRDERITNMLTKLTLTEKPSARFCVLCAEQEIAVGQTYFCTTCSGLSRSEMFNQFLQLLRTASKKSFAELENVCKSLKPIVSSFALVYSPAQLFDNRIHNHDAVAAHYLTRYCDKPFQGNTAIPIGILGDGNCFYNTFVTLSTAGTTTEASSLTPVELRARNVIELVTNLDQYKAKHQELTDFIDPAPDYITKEMVCDANYVAIWDLLSIPSVLKIKVTTIYPRVNGDEDLNYAYLNRKDFDPLEGTKPTSSNPPEPFSEVKLLFSHSNRWTAKTKEEWVPNHYVPILKLSS